MHINANSEEMLVSLPNSHFCYLTVKSTLSAERHRNNTEFSCNHPQQTQFLTLAKLGVRWGHVSLVWTLVWITTHLGVSVFVCQTCPCVSEDSLWCRELWGCSVCTWGRCSAPSARGPRTLYERRVCKDTGVLSKNITLRVISTTLDIADRTRKSS